MAKSKKASSNPTDAPSAITSLDDLKEWDKNPRSIDPKAFEGLKVSIGEYGDLSGIVWNQKLGALVCGHQRIKAIRDAFGKDAKIEGNVIYLPNGTRFQIRIVEWEPAHHIAAAITANNPYITGEFNGTLKDLLDELQRKSPELVDTLRMDRLKIDYDKFWADQVLKENQAPPLPSSPRSKPGDLYELGAHRLLCGDSTEATSYHQLLQGKKAQLIFTDPPYNVDYESESGSTYASMKFGGNGGKIFNDNKSEKDCLEFYVRTLQQLHEHTRDSAVLYWWFAHVNNPVNRQALAIAGWRYGQTINWLKNSFVFAHGQDFHRCYEPCMVAWKEGMARYSSKMFNNLTDMFSVDVATFTEQFDVWYEQRDITNHYVHPTQKPVRLAERALKKNSRIGDIVLDVFGGSGSTMIGCEQMERRCFLIELDPKFCDVIVSRWVLFTGKHDITLNGKPLTWQIEP